MIRALIIDDEENCCESLSLLLAKYCPEVEVIAYATSAVEGRSLIRQHKPDVIFLDVEMPNETGFNLLEKLGEVDFQVIFTTAYNEYALQAIKARALDYLLKPVDSDDLKEAVSRLSISRERNIRAESIARLRGESNQVAIPTMSGLEFFPMQEVLWCKASSNYTIVHLVNGAKITATKSLKEFEDILGQFHFCRVHHSNLVNLNHVRKYIKGDGGTIILSDGTEVEVSARKKSDFLGRLNIL